MTPAGTATKAAGVMLRPTVAVTNCARAGETSCLDIGAGACAGTNLIRMQLICPTGPNKLPKRGQNVNEARKTASSHGPAVGQLVRSNCRAKSDGGDFFGPGSDRIPGKTSLFARI